MKEPIVRGSIGPVHVASFLFIKKLQESRRLGKFLDFAVCQTQILKALEWKLLN